MAQGYGDAYLEWIKSAEEASEKEDYEAAARLYRHVTIHFGVNNDLPNQRKYAIKTGECHLKAARNHLAKNDLVKTVLSCAKAYGFFIEGGHENLAASCDAMIKECYDAIRSQGIAASNISNKDLKLLGDYFVKKGIFEDAAKCYQAAAENACENGKVVLAGGLYRDVGDCYRMLGDFEKAAENYATAGDMFLKGQKHFEAAQHYCQSGFLFIIAGKLDEASVVANKASLACDEGGIDVIMNDLSKICRLLSEKALVDAGELWSRIRMKFKGSYANLIDSCFDFLRST